MNPERRAEVLKMEVIGNVEADGESLQVRKQLAVLADSSLTRWGPLYVSETNPGPGESRGYIGSWKYHLKT
jgi:hypothetical protein